MGERRVPGPWLAALLSWIIATGLAVLLYGAWKLSQGEPLNWGVVRMAAGIAALLAVLRAFLDRPKA